MRPHKRNGKAAKAARQQHASERRLVASEEGMGEDALLHAIFGAHEECMECGASKLTSRDCQTPHCKALRDESPSSTMYAGLDY